MTAALPWMLIAIGLLAGWLEGDKGNESSPKDRLMPGLIGFVLLGIVIVLGLSQGLFGFAFEPGIVAAVLALALWVWNPHSLVGSVALGGSLVASPAITYGGPAETLFLHLAMAGVVAVGGALVGSRGASGFAAVAFTGCIGRHFLIENPSPKVQMIAGSLVLGATLVGLIFVAVRSKLPEKGIPAANFVVCLGTAIVGYVIGNALSPETMIGPTVAAAGILAALISWSLPGSEDPKTPATVTIAFAGLVWLGLATFAFSNDRTLGIALATMLGVTALAMVGSHTGLITVAPVLALLAHRAVRNLYPDMTKAFDLGQHYALVGILIAVCVVLALAPVLQQSTEGGLKVKVSAGLALLLAVATSVISVVFLGAKGGTGLLVGLGIAPILLLAQSKGRQTALSVSAALVGIVGLAYPRISELFEATRDEKIGLFWVTSIVGAVLAIALILLNRPSKKETVVESV